MTTDAAFDTLRQHGFAECTAEFFMSGTPAKSFSSLRECLLNFAADLEGEPLPTVRVHTDSGDIAINGPELEHMIALAKVTRIAW
jgi:hypothetical protein